MAIAGVRSKKLQESYKPWSWDAEYLQLAVREPFPSRTSSTELVYGRVMRGSKLIVRSLMPESGVIFSDGIEADYLAFSSGTTAEIGVAKTQGTLIT